MHVAECLIMNELPPSTIPSPLPSNAVSPPPLTPNRGALRPAVRGRLVVLSVLRIAPDGRGPAPGTGRAPRHSVEDVARSPEPQSGHHDDQTASPVVQAGASVCQATGGAIKVQRFACGFRG